MQFLRQSTASQTRTLGPFLDDTDGKTPETSLTIANTDVKLLKNGAASANKNSGGGTHLVNGEYSFTFNATDTNTVGELKINISVAGSLPVFSTYYVLEESVFDAMFGASSVGPLTINNNRDVVDESLKSLAVGSQPRLFFRAWNADGSPYTAANAAAITTATYQRLVNGRWTAGTSVGTVTDGNNSNAWAAGTLIRDANDLLGNLYSIDVPTAAVEAGALAARLNVQIQTGTTLSPGTQVWNFDDLIPTPTTNVNTQIVAGGVTGNALRCNDNTNYQFSVSPSSSGLLSLSVRHFGDNDGYFRVIVYAGASQLSNTQYLGSASLPVNGVGYTTISNISIPTNATRVHITHSGGEFSSNYVLVDNITITNQNVTSPVFGATIQPIVAPITSSSAASVDLQPVLDKLPESGRAAAVGAAMTLSTGERDTLAGVIDARLLNAGDATDLIASIVTRIGNTNVDQAAFVAAVKATLFDSSSAANKLAVDSSGRVTIGTNTDKTGYLLSTAPLDAAGMRNAIGLGSANLDTQLADIPTVAEFEARSIPSADYFVVGDYTAPANSDITAIKAKTDNLPASPASSTDVQLLAVQNISPTIERINGDTDAIRFTWPVDSATITGEVSKNGGSYAAVVGAITQRTTQAGVYWYQLAHNAADRTLGSIRYKFTDGTRTRFVNLLVNPATASVDLQPVLDKLPESGRATTLTASDVWSHATRSLTTFGTLVSDIWSHATRTLTAISDSSGITTLLSRIAGNIRTSADDVSAETAQTAAVRAGLALEATVDAAETAILAAIDGIEGGGGDCASLAEIEGLIDNFIEETSDRPVLVTIPAIEAESILLAQAVTRYRGTLWTIATEGLLSIPDKCVCTMKRATEPDSRAPFQVVRTEPTDAETDGLKILAGAAHATPAQGSIAYESYSTTAGTRYRAILTLQAVASVRIRSGVYRIDFKDVDTDVVLGEGTVNVVTPVTDAIA